MEAHQKVAAVISEVWETKNYDLLRDSLSDSVVWQEGTFEEPLSGSSAVIKQWKSDLSVQNNIHVNTKVLGINGNEGYYQCRASWNDKNKGPRELDGILLVRINQDGLIEYLNSWWTEKQKQVARPNNS